LNHRLDFLEDFCRLRNARFTVTALSVRAWQKLLFLSNFWSWRITIAFQISFHFILQFVAAEEQTIAPQAATSIDGAISISPTVNRAFLRGRVSFVHRNAKSERAAARGNSPAPSMLLAYGEKCSGWIDECNLPGTLAILKKREQEAVTN
jgi:hypothetical protein